MASENDFSSTVTSKPTSHSVSQDEIAHFSALAHDWWNPRGPMAPLHAMNPLRTQWVADRIAPLQAARGERLSLLDIGCGAGIASEAYAKLGFDTLGLDASLEGIEAAKTHLAEEPLPASAAQITYRHGSAETLVEEGQKFDVVSALEVIEHVTDPQGFLHLLADLTLPGGMIAVSTLNRTARSYVVAKLGAEYILRLLPVGTHDWKKFIKPEELARMARNAGLRMTDVSGMSYIPPKWRATRDTGVNYITIFTKD
ncbi:3-demethylubiquinone-9 3-methyltransferase [Neokomagataea thailandica NBRC 106555]|uniref:Ubiquinone biosynthesis O-methyltransferase n=2 Tax=Neokomagataea TaxID=1223423 RepID=A0A4Y6V5P2_9PROT|nr:MULTISPECIES: bifunctional 2-polyprenyl-6-hydroxyphenol methylase/3-demethylubiquinol 3-O-methyltransferase UbiG [Neokomagataea]QDH23951.1 bifunctional 2-polyprenyl-6-hydroxyphenol methylase/3-demethylubiquinol 3-O-methyltransferase UbiG [Neokomagataea tanensis]GBR54557.1 3-demethylubiquinone-9 3-methyltransferase [Neokomagataea thailandica NBRC 106555]